MLKSLKNRPVTVGLTPWATNDDEELASLLPEIVTKKKKKKPKNYNSENKPPADHPKDHTKILFQPNHNISFSSNQLFPPSSTEQKLPKPKIEDKENDLNFIKKSKKSKPRTESTNRQIICPKPPTSQRKYVRSSNYITLQDQMGCKINHKNQTLLKDIMSTQICNSDRKKLKDVHSLHLIEKLKGISNTQEPVKTKDLHQKQKIHFQNPFLDYLSQNNGFRQHQKRVLTQRGPKQFSLKTQGHQNQAKNQLNFLKKTTKNSSYLTHRKQITKNNEESAMMWSENQNFNIESTFALKTSTVLKQCREVKSVEMKSASCQKSNLLRLGKLIEGEIPEEGSMEGKFAGIEFQSKPQYAASSTPLQPINYELNQMQSVEIPAMKAKVSFLIQKSQLSVKPSLINKEKFQEKELGEEEKMSQKMEQEIKRNLRKLRGYLVKKTRDQCLEKVNLDENELLVYESNQNYFRTE